MLACASEDADWLAQGVLSSISQKNVALAVFGIRESLWMKQQNWNIVQL